MTCQAADLPVQRYCGAGAGASREPKSQIASWNWTQNFEFRLQLQLLLLSIYHRLEGIFNSKTMVAEEVFVNCYNFNPIIKVKIGNFQGIL